MCWESGKCALPFGYVDVKVGRATVIPEALTETDKKLKDAFWVDRS